MPDSVSNYPSSVQQPAAIVIFGITGDLAQKKLLPALYHLLKNGLLHEKTVIVGITRRDVTADEVLSNVADAVNATGDTPNTEGLDKVKNSLRMHKMSMTEGSDYDELLKYLNKLEEEQGMCLNRLYYLSIPPQVMGPIVHNLGEHGLNATCQHASAASRLLVEKPFGYNLSSAKELIENTGKWFGEDQIFRIDHYLAKETAQNILAFKMHNPIFAGIWNAQHITRVEITASEQIGIEGRATFYEQTGALRDFVQSHLMQLLAVVAMEPPKNLDSDTIHAAKQTLLENVEIIHPDEVAIRAKRAQYEGYKKEVDKDDSFVETYASLSLTINTPRWKDVPFIVRTGKALSEKRTDIVVIFDGLADANGTETDKADHNELNLRIQPNEGIDVVLNAKKPGYTETLQPVVMDFRYEDNFKNNGHPDAYERVLVDAVRGDHTLFATGDEVLASWRVVEAVVHAWETNGQGLTTYPVGTSLTALEEMTS
jgi:glucose-6-phosphate 1-dehydrogenase